MKQIGSRGGVVAARRLTEEFQPPRPRPEVAEVAFWSPTLLTMWSDPVDKSGGLPEEAEEEIGVEEAAAEVNAALAEVKTAVTGDMVVDTAGRVPWWLTWL